MRIIKQEIPIPDILSEMECECEKCHSLLLVSYKDIKYSRAPIVQLHIIDYLYDCPVCKYRNYLPNNHPIVNYYKKENNIYENYSK